MRKIRRKNATGESSILDSLLGGKEIPFSISLDFVTVSYLGIVILVAGILLIVINKKLIK
jgi:hypothetical protein